MSAKFSTCTTSRDVLQPVIRKFSGVCLISYGASSSNFASINQNVSQDELFDSVVSFDRTVSAREHCGRKCQADMVSKAVEATQSPQHALAAPDENTANEATFDLLSDDICILIFRNVGGRTLASLSSVCKRFSNIIRVNDLLWGVCMFNDFSIAQKERPPKGETFRSLYLSWYNALVGLSDHCKLF
mmetsp:Transcript_42662/g.69163  ORF Transcript_42662/g.69163 Transcript_42662/m.69163 type:complete len:187 (+) Transcript_42662:96-656(+)